MTDQIYDNLTINKHLDMKAPDGNNYIRIYCDYDGMSGNDPTLFITQWIQCLKSVSAYGGFLGTDSDWTNTNPWHGGGAIMMGYGLTGPTDPPRFILTHSNQPKLYLQATASDGSNYPGHLNMGILETKGEAHMCYSSYSDPAPGTQFAIKVGDLGIAVNGTSVFNNNLYVNGFWFKSAQQYGCDKSLSGTLVERKFKTTDDALSFLTHEVTKEWLHIKYGEKDGTIICTCGKEQAKPCPEHKDEWEDKYALKTSDMIQASAKTTVDLVERIKSLEAKFQDRVRN